MKSTGMVRRVDELGRVVIPKEIRNKLGIEERDPLDIYIDGFSIVLRKSQSNCIFCGNTRDLVEYKEKLVCQKCINNIKTK